MSVKCGHCRPFVIRSSFKTDGEQQSKCDMTRAMAATQAISQQAIERMRNFMARETAGGSNGGFGTSSVGDKFTAYSNKTPVPLVVEHLGDVSKDCHKATVLLTRWLTTG